jgi:Cof subfamily protein (haloacid dehalogenase superfamily)
MLESNTVSVVASPKEDAFEQKENLSSISHSPCYRMVALDLDGTLLQRNHQMADIQANYLRELYARGFVVCIATGRPLGSALDHIAKLNIAGPIPVVCSNGARGMLCDANDNSQQELFYDPVPKDVVSRAIELGNKLGCATQYYHFDDIYCNQKTELHYEKTTLYSSITGSTVHHVEDEFESLLSQDKLPSKLLLLFDKHQCEDVCAAFTKEFKGKASLICGSSDWYMEILKSEVTKGHGLAKMCSKLNISMESCIAMGDGANDIEFLQMAGRGVAMKNGMSVLKKVADEVMIWTNDQHGVMKTLEKMDGSGLLAFDKTNRIK